MEDTTDGEVVRAQGEMLVRRFTDTLSGELTLEQATISAQAEEDRILQQNEEARISAVYEDRTHDYLDFSEANIAREALNMVCKRFAEEEKPSKLAKFGFQRRSARAKANDAMQQSVARDFTELQDVINGIETKWQASHGPVYRNFQRLCQTLDSHQKIFAIFPQQNTYCAVLCGTLSLFVSAAVNNNNVAETISKAVADISEKAARCAKHIQYVSTSAMKNQISQLYSHVFTFYRDAMEWYLSSKTSKLFGSFNEKLKEKFESAARQIDSCIDEIYREGHLALLGMVYNLQTSTVEMRTELFRQRQEPRDESSLNAAGRFMQEMLKAVHQHAISSRSTPLQIPFGASLSHDAAMSPRVSGVLSRAEARDCLAHITRFIVGDEGQSLLGNEKSWSPDADASWRLQDWMSGERKSTTLWISSPDISAAMSSAQAAAMVAVAAAWQSETPIISHFCRRPRSFEVSSRLAIENAGLLGMVYSFIVQLLQFHVDNDTFTTSEEDVELLDGSTKSWPMSMSLFTKLVGATPQLSMCVVHGLNDLMWSDGTEWGQSFMKCLTELQRTSSLGFRVLLTTSGQSRVLPDSVKIEDRVFSEGPAQEVLRSATVLPSTTRM